jgi:hypothetical protein
VAGATSDQFSVVFGGIAAVLGTLLVARLYPELMGEDGRAPVVAAAEELAPDALDDP